MLLYNQTNKMVEEMMCEVSDYKTQKVSQQDDALRLCTTKNSNNLVDKMPNGNSKSIAKDNKSSGKELKSLQMKTMFSSKNHWHNLLMRKKESHPTNGTKIKETRRSKNLFVDMLEGRFEHLKLLIPLQFYIYFV